MDLENLYDILSWDTKVCIKEIFLPKMKIVFSVFYLPSRNSETMGLSILWNIKSYSLRNEWFFCCCPKHIGYKYSSYI